MTLNFSDLAQQVRSGQPLSSSDFYDLLTASPAATFALADLAAEIRTAHFGSYLTAGNLPGAEEGSGPATFLDLSTYDPQKLADQLAHLATDPAAEPGQLGILWGPEAQWTPMEALRVLLTLRLALPQQSLHLGAEREKIFRSLQPLALRVIDSLELAYQPAEPQLIFEDLKLIVGAGLTLAGAENRNLVEEYVQALTDAGVQGAPALAQSLLGPEGQTGGCGGSCACGSGGC
ncbi:MAG: hypothetical protein SOR40_00820 [Rothia sp. (in: high G+C Gram-positive bacteria)]|nr:hypothetical protein [Rothia sp. (in: high G+C Gram-positive bacteria)]